MLAGHRQRMESDQQHRQALAYYQAYMAGVFSQPYPKGKYPAFEKHAPWKKVHKPAKRQSWQQQKMLVQALNAAFGGTISKKVH